MSECVVRMEMPRNCHECPVSHQSFGDTPCWCKLAFEKNEAVSDGLMWREVDPQTRPDWCPIICQLPEGHGRLVDVDALHKIAWPVKDHTGRIEECVQMRDLYKAPTIVPAEAERSEA